jgi:hypothetical protein
MLAGLFQLSGEVKKNVIVHGFHIAEREGEWTYNTGYYRAVSLKNLQYDDFCIFYLTKKLFWKCTFKIGDLQ